MVNTESSGVLGQDYHWFKNYGRSGSNVGKSVLPPQAIPMSKKTKEWEKACMDNLEKEGLAQYMENLPLADYYKMMSGDMIYMDVDDNDKDVILDYIGESKKALDLPDTYKHWDLMSPVVQQIVGGWSIRGDKFRFDTTDEYSTNDYIREKSFRLSKFAEAMFKAQLNKLSVLYGINPTQQFNSEEEYQQHQQQLQKIIKDYFPANIEQDMNKNWKTQAAQWGEKTWKRDYERFGISNLEYIEGVDILCTGKCFRHFRIGKDYYFPENWRPIEVFHSKESGVNRAEDCEYIGRIVFYTISELINTYGHILSENQRNAVYKSFFGPEYADYLYPESGVSDVGAVNVLGTSMFGRVDVPFEGYFDHKLALQTEKITGVPLSIRTDLATGEKRPTFSMPLNSEDGLLNYGTRLAQNLRTDFKIRTDTIRVTEAYWKGFKKIGIISYREKSGYLTTVEVDEDLLPEVKKEYGIKNLKKVSFNDYDKLSESEKENTIIWIDVPMVYKGIKIQCSGIDNPEDIYHVEELPFQIKGEKGNIFDIKLPVSGHIGNSYCKKIRNYQVLYNYLMNQFQSYMYKEIGGFMVLDVASLPTEHFDLGQDEDKLLNLRNLINLTGFMPTDLSRNNLNQNGGGLVFNPMSYQNMTFTDQMNRNIQLSDRIKWMAYEQLGLTPQNMGAPSQYMTAEGIQVGQQAMYAQTYNIDQVLLRNKQAGIILHMAVAQYCQLNGKDVDYLFVSDDNELQFLKSIKEDEYFALRQIGVRPIYDSKRMREFEQVKAQLLSNNTMGNDVLSMAKLALSDDFMELVEAGTKMREYNDKIRQEQYQHENEMQQRQLEFQQKVHDDKMAVDHEKNKSRVEAASLQAMGRVGDNLNDGSGLDEIKITTDAYLRNKEIEYKDDLNRQKLENNLKEAMAKVDQRAEEILLKKKELDIKSKALDVRREEANKKNFDSIINKN